MVEPAQRVEKLSPHGSPESDPVRVVEFSLDDGGKALELGMNDQIRGGRQPGNIFIRDEGRKLLIIFVPIPARAPGGGVAIPVFMPGPGVLPPGAGRRH